MKKLILSAGLMTVGLLATDFSQMSIAELNAMRGSVSTQDKSAYKAEVQNRLKAMDEAERNTYRAERRNGSSSGEGSMKQHRYRSGSGSGGGGMHRGSGGGGGRR
ncbi:DUF1104 domain-containing protein [Sulfurovum sp. CS9]|uniref:DUF1104 domain-containing protein n=1 Tax=Sulfurovum sp. CS9 TaxID=3391146 RepID=UPI0039ECEFC7